MADVGVGTLSHRLDSLRTPMRLYRVLTLLVTTDSVATTMDVRAGFLGTVHPSRQPAAVPAVINLNLTAAARPCLELTCPQNAKFIYGGTDSGFYCCPEPTAHGDCGSPACTKGGRKKDCACCIFPAPGSKACQGATKCPGAPNNDPKNTTICPIKPMPPGPPGPPAPPAPPPPPPPPPPACINLTCPVGRSHIYGGQGSGFYCCPEPTTSGDCSSPACTKGGPKECACCIFPAAGSTGCQGATKCPGAPNNDPKHTTICPINPAAASPSVQDYFGFGSAMVYNTAETEGGMSLKESVLYHCRNASVNQLSMLIAPPTEGGVISNPKDSNPWQPLAKAGTGYHGNVGMVQAAARFSLMTRTVGCPQATGVVIDDFLQQYIGNNDTSHCVNLTCPVGQSHIYGNPESGEAFSPSVSAFVFTSTPSALPSLLPLRLTQMSL
eukprot:COSAG06_NODE_4677_length_4043_cov_3.965264_2_plen_439_part_00